MQLWIITIYRRDSESPVVYENVKHAWTDSHGIYVVSQITDKKSGKHRYFKWPWSLISHVKEERK